MSIVIDINTLSAVLKEENSKNSVFKPVRDWIIDNGGKLVIGGHTYLKELKTGSLLSLVNELARMRKVAYISDDAVDAEEQRVNGLIVSGGFDDGHIMGLLFASRCTLLCSADKRSYKFIKNKAYYPKNMKKVKIYSSRKNIKLLDIQKCPDLHNLIN